MKKQVLLGMGLMAAMSFSLQAWAASDIMKAELTRFEIDGKLIGQTQVDSAMIEVNLKQGTAKLTLFQLWSCPPGMMCADGGSSQPLVFEALVVKKEKDSCGSHVMFVEAPQNMHKHAKVKMEIRNHQTDNCQSYRPVPDTEVVLYVDLVNAKGRVVKTQSVFEGGRLE